MSKASARNDEAFEWYKRTFELFKSLDESHKDKINEREQKFESKFIGIFESQGDACKKSCQFDLAIRSYDRALDAFERQDNKYKMSNQERWQRIESKIDESKRRRQNNSNKSKKNNRVSSGSPELTWARNTEY